MTRLALLHTNDLHGQFDQMPRLMTLINRERALATAEGRALLLLDAGDSSERKIWESDVTQGRANFAMLDAMGCQATALGNNEGRWGLEALTKLVASAHFPVLAANLLPPDSDEPPAGLRTHTWFEIGDLKIAVVGLTSEDKPKLYERLHCRPRPAIEALRDLIPRLRHEGAHLILLLSHLGISSDRKLAAAVPGIHVILGGHSHTFLEQPQRVRKTLIAQLGPNGDFLGRLDLTLDSATRQITSTSYAAIPCGPDVPPDPTLSGLLELVRFEAEVLRKKTEATRQTTNVKRQT
ncbi:MAG: metallophosphatase [Chloroflexi bacterium]|nr:metallophosphatase [Chloroflexota bacterium]